MTLQDLEARFAAVSAEPLRTTRISSLAWSPVGRRFSGGAARELRVGARARQSRMALLSCAQGQNTVFYPHFRSDLHAGNGG
jgi:hypothetical protein